MQKTRLRDVKVRIRRTLAAWALALVTVAGAAPFAQAQDADEQEQPDPVGDEAAAMLDQLMGLGAQEINPDDVTAEVWVKRPLEAQRVLRLGDQYFLQEAGDGRLLIGREEDDGTIESGTWGLRERVDRMLRRGNYAELPEAPEGWKVREVFRLPGHPVRIAGFDGGRRLFVLCQNGDVWRVDPASGQGELVLTGSDYAGGRALAQGLTIDDRGRLYIVINRRDSEPTPVVNRVTLFRSEPLTTADGPVAVTPWFETSYPRGVGGFDHGVGHIAQGPDGMIYVGSGSRTDANEEGDVPRHSKVGEVELTSCIWRLDPNAAQPEMTIFAQGLRNPFGFCWDARGRMFATDNGPDKDPPGELNLVEEGGHYGFPYVFSDWAESPYSYTPEAPEGLSFVPPIPVVGDGAGSAAEPIASFTPHSCPAGIAYLGEGFPERYRGGFLVARFGNFLNTRNDGVGFDLLFVKLEEGEGGEVRGRSETFLDPLSRPIAVQVVAPGKVYLTEYSRATDPHNHTAQGLPGRVLELTVEPTP